MRVALCAALMILAASGSDEHNLTALPPVRVGAAPVPIGPPRTIAVAPGQDLAAAVASAPAGSTLRLLAGRHDGPLVIDRPLRVEGEAGAALVGPGGGTVLIVAAPDSRVSGLRVTGSGTNANVGDAGVLVGADRVVLEDLIIDDALIGIDLRQANDGVVRRCAITGRLDRPLGQRGDGIRLWESNHNRIEDNTLEGVRDLVVWYSSHNTLTRNTVAHGRYGTHFMHADDNKVLDNTYDHDVVGVFVMYSDGIEIRGNTVTGANGEAGVGLGFKESSDLIVADNRLIGSTTGLYVDGTPHRLGSAATFTGNLLAYDHVGLRMHGVQGGAVFEGNEFHEDALPVSIDGNADALADRFSGNRWSDYEGYDLDGDGYGDLPYVLRSATTSMTDRKPELAFFTGTPAAALLDLLAAAFPMFAPRPLVRDDHPRM